jgi:transposase InsO family protein
LASSAVHAVLVRCRLNRLSHIDRITGEPIRRYEHPYPGSMLHVDVKKLGNVPDGGGWRYVGREQGKKNRSATKDKTRSRDSHPLIGTAFVRTVLDDHSRVAYAEIHDDERATTAVAALRRAVAWFAARGVHIERVLSDNGSAYRSRLWRDTCVELGVTHKRTRPPLPATDQRQDRTLPPHPGRRLGVQTFLYQRTPTSGGYASMDSPVQPPPAPHRDRQDHTHQRLNQPGWSVHLGRP